MTGHASDLDSHQIQKLVNNIPNNADTVGCRKKKPKKSFAAWKESGRK
jgi:hypothetical protein